MTSSDTGTTCNMLKVHPLRVEEVKHFGLWGRHKDLRFQEYNFPNLATKKGSYALHQWLWFYKRNVPFLRWLYGIEDAGGRLVGYFKIVKKRFSQKHAELSMIMDPDVMGRRYGTDTIIPLLKICFYKLDLERVWVRVLAFNTRPLRLLEKIGFEHYKHQLEPYSDQRHSSALLKSYPNDFTLTADKLMTNYCYLQLNKDRFQALCYPKCKPTNSEPSKATIR